MFGMGIGDDNAQSYTGKCYKTGYISGLETLTKSERKEFLKLLKDAQKEIKSMQDYESELKVLDEKKKKYSGLLDAAKSGKLDIVGSEQFENMVYSEYANIRNECNQFYRQIKDLEQKRDALWLKYNHTPDDDKLIEQYNIQIQKLMLASENWSISTSGKNLNSVRQKNEIAVNSKESYTTAIKENAGSGLSEEKTVNINYSNSNYNTTVDFKYFNRNLSQTAVQESNSTVGGNTTETKTSNSNIDGAQTSLNVNYSRGSNIKLYANSTVDLYKITSEESKENFNYNFNQSLNGNIYGFKLNLNASAANESNNLSKYVSGSVDYDYANWIIGVNGRYSSYKNKPAEGVEQYQNAGSGNYEYGLSLKRNMGKCISANIAVSESGVVESGKSKLNEYLKADTQNSMLYSAGLQGNFNGKIGQFSYTIAPGADIKYNNLAQSTTYTPSINGSISYYKQDINASLNIMENCSVSTYKDETSPSVTNMFTVSASAGCKNLSVSANSTFMTNNTNTSSGVSTSNTVAFGANVEYKRDNIALNAGYTNNSTSFVYTGDNFNSNSDTKSGMFVFGARIDLSQHKNKTRNSEF